MRKLSVVFLSSAAALSSFRPDPVSPQSVSPMDVTHDDSYYPPDYPDYQYPDENTYPPAKSYPRSNNYYPEDGNYPPANVYPNGNTYPPANRYRKGITYAPADRYRKGNSYAPANRFREGITYAPSKKYMNPPDQYSLAQYPPPRAPQYQPVNMPHFSIYNIAGALPPLDVFDPLNLGTRCDEDTLKRYREAELVHGRVAMLATVGFIAGEAVAPLKKIKGPAIKHLSQVHPFWLFCLAAAITWVEVKRARIGFVEPWKLPFDRPGMLRHYYYPGELGFDPLRLRPRDRFDYYTMEDRELQNGRLAMIAAAGFMAQELVNGKGILQNLGL